MFDLETFLADCEQAMDEAEPRLAIRDVLARAVASPGEVERALPATRAEIVPLHVTPRLCVLKVIWAPGMAIPPHDHLMWAAIGLYGGREDNTYYRRQGAWITRAGGRQLGTSDVALLGDDVVHAVANPTATYTGAIHVYGGDLTRQTGRTEWPDPAGAGVDYDFSGTRRYFDEANARAVATPGLGPTT